MGIFGTFLSTVPFSGPSNDLPVTILAVAKTTCRSRMGATGFAKRTLSEAHCTNRASFSFEVRKNQAEGGLSKLSVQIVFVGVGLLCRSIFGGGPAPGLAAAFASSISSRTAFYFLFLRPPLPPNSSK